MMGYEHVLNFSVCVTHGPTSFLSHYTNVCSYDITVFTHNKKLRQHIADVTHSVSLTIFVGNDNGV